MSNREALRRLSRKFPAPPELQKILDDLKNDNDMSVAIMGAALLEGFLEQVLTQKFTYKSSALLGQAFRNRGPFSDFHGKIIAAEAFGIITPYFAAELHSVKAIRNTFAHSKMPITFGHELITKEIAASRMYQAFQGAQKDSAHKLTLDNKGWFLLFTRFLLILLDGIKKHPSSAGQTALQDMLEGKL